MSHLRCDFITSAMSKTQIIPCNVNIQIKTEKLYHAHSHKVCFHFVVTVMLLLFLFMMVKRKLFNKQVKNSYLG